MTKLTLLPGVLFLLLALLTSCARQTNDPNEAFSYWSGMRAPSSLRLMKAQYYESPHFTKEYILYLQLKPPVHWWKAYLQENGMTIDRNSWTFPDDVPDWFRPGNNAVRYGRPDHYDQGSRYFRDTLTGICYIYEIQL